MGGETKRKAVDMKYKLEAVASAESTSVSAAAKKFKVDRRRIREWREQKPKLEKAYACQQYVAP